MSPVTDLALICVEREGSSRGTESEILVQLSERQSGRQREKTDSWWTEPLYCLRVSLWEACRLCRDFFYPNTGNCDVTHGFTKLQIKKLCLKQRTCLFGFGARCCCWSAKFKLRWRVSYSHLHCFRFYLSHSLQPTSIWLFTWTWYFCDSYLFVCKITEVSLCSTCYCCVA